MNLGVLEGHLWRALHARVGDGVDLHTGPAHGGPATGLRPEVFVHAARFADGGGSTADGAVIARRPAAAASGASGFIEERPAQIEIEVTCVCGTHAQAQALAGRVAAPLLEALETLQAIPLGNPATPLQRLVFGDHRALLLAGSSQRLLHDGVAVGQVVLTLRLQGFLQVQLLREGGLHKASLYEVPITLALTADPEGTDLQREHLLLRNDSASTLDLGGWTVQDAAPRRPHRYTFAPGRLLAAGASLRLCSGRGSDDAQHLYWGRRQAVWTNTGDIARLFDPDGVERAQAVYPPAVPAAPAATPSRQRRK